MTETILKVDGMACGMCESHINDTVRNKFSVQKVTSSHTKGETVILSEQPWTSRRCVRPSPPPATRSQRWTPIPTRKRVSFPSTESDPSKKRPPPALF